MGQILLVRHGQDTDTAAGILNGRRDPKLTVRGVQQARETAKTLVACDIAVIYASPLKRAHATARIIAETLGIRQVFTDERLMEREYGILTGKPTSDIPRYAAKMLQTGVTHFIAAEGAESFSSLLGRAQNVLRDLQKRHSVQNILIVAHAGIGRMLRGAALGLSWRESLNTPPFGNGDIWELIRTK